MVENQRYGLTSPRPPALVPVATASSCLLMRSPSSWLLLRSVPSPPSPLAAPGALRPSSRFPSLPFIFLGVPSLLLVVSLPPAPLLLLLPLVSRLGFGLSASIFCRVRRRRCLSPHLFGQVRRKCGLPPRFIGLPLPLLLLGFSPSPLLLGCTLPCLHRRSPLLFFLPQFRLPCLSPQLLLFFLFFPALSELDAGFENNHERGYGITTARLEALERTRTRRQDRQTGRMGRRRRSGSSSAKDSDR